MNNDQDRNALDSFADRDDAFSNNASADDTFSSAEEEMSMNVISDRERDHSMLGSDLFDGFADAKDDTEFSAEAGTANAPVRTFDRAPADRSDNTADGGIGAMDGSRMSGWAAIVLAIASLFIWPAILAPAAVVVGLIALYAGNRTLGLWSIVIGVISFIVNFAITPLFS